MDYYIFETRYSDRIASPKSTTLTYDDFNEISSGKFLNSSFDLEFKVESKKVLSPILNPASVGFYFLDSSIVEHLKRENICGADFIPVSFKNEKNEIIQKEYYVLSVSSTSDEIDYTKSIFQGDGFVSGIFVNNINLIESDVFRPLKSLFIIVNEKFKKILERHDVNNVNFTNIVDVKFPEFLIKNKIN